jgi:hypothetical protein
MATQRKFTFNAAKLPEGHVFRGQAKVIVNHLSANPGQTVKEMTAAIGSFEGSRQDPERVVGFYMTVWKKKGWVKAVDAEVAEVPVVAEDTVGEAAEADSGEEEEAEDEEIVEAGEYHPSLEEKMPLEQRVNFEDEMSAASPDDHGGKFDGLKMTEAVRAALKLIGENMPDTIAAYLTENGYTAAKNQVTGALIGLVRQGVVKKSSAGSYALRAEV